MLRLVSGALCTTLYQRNKGKTGLLFSCQCGTARPPLAEPKVRLQICNVAADISNKPSRKADVGAPVALDRARG